jgi:transcription elongation factor GreA
VRTGAGEDRPEFSFAGVLAGARSGEMDRQIILTSQGLEKFEKELVRLRTVHRKEVADRIRDSKQFGEFTENAEYEDAKMQQAFVEGRILELENILTNALSLEDVEVPTDQVAIGCRVKLRVVSNNVKAKSPVKKLRDIQYLVVDPIEANPAEGMISNESPVGRSLMGRKVGDTIEVRVPSGTVKYKVLSISR